MGFVNSARLAENILLSRRHKSRLSVDASAKAVVASLCRGCPTARTLWLQLTPKQNAGCRSCESSSGIAVDVQQRLNCALPSFSLSSDSLSRFEVFTACPGSDQLIHSAELAVDLSQENLNLRLGSLDSNLCAFSLERR